MFFSEKDKETIKQVMNPSILKIYDDIYGINKSILILQDAVITVQKAILLLQQENEIKREKTND